MGTIILYGMRGCGKTTIGKALAERVGYPFYDLDLAIQEDTKMSVFTLVERDGWEAFRHKEHENLLKILELDGDKIISLGGGAITFENNQKILLKKSEKLIYIKSPLEIIQERIEKDEHTGNKRNSLTGKGLQEELMEIYEKRKGCYESFYDFKVNNANSTETCVREILEKLPFGKICVPIINFDISSLKRQIQEINIAREIRMIELRVDFIGDNPLPPILEAIQGIQKPIIITNRSIREGGQFVGTPDQSIQYINKFRGYGDYIDIELSMGDYAQQLEGEKLILSYHNFDYTPSLGFLIEKLNEMNTFSPYVYKIAVMPKTQSDVDTIYALHKYFSIHYPGKRNIFISMGELGRETRINVPKMGGWLTFGSINDSSAPGQLQYRDLYKKIFN